MGLFDRVLGREPQQKKPTDDVLLFHAMILMCAADGAIEDSEKATVAAFFTTLPEFRGKEFEKMLAASNRLFQKYGNARESVKALSEITSPAVRKKCFVLAADIAMSSGDIDDNEEQLLEAMQRVLAVDEPTAQKVIEVLAMKYMQ